MTGEKLSSVMLTINHGQPRTYRIPLPPDEALTVTSILEHAKDAMYIHDLEIHAAASGRPTLRINGHPEVSGRFSWEPHLNGVPMFDDFERELGPGDYVLWEHTKL